MFAARALWNESRAYITILTGPVSMRFCCCFCIWLRAITERSTAAGLYRQVVEGCCAVQVEQRGKLAC